MHTLSHSWRIQGPCEGHSLSQQGRFMPLERDSYPTKASFVEGFEE